MLCLVVERFPFELASVEDFAEVVDSKMALLAQDSMSAKALKQITYLQKRERPTAAKPEEPVQVESVQEAEAALAEELKQEEEREEREALVAGPRALTVIDRKKILRLVLTVVIPDLKK